MESFPSGDTACPGFLKSLQSRNRSAAVHRVTKWIGQKLQVFFWDEDFKRIDTLPGVSVCKLPSVAPQRARRSPT